MAIEIRELVVRASVTNENKQSDEPTGQGIDAKLLNLKRKIIQECMEQIQEALDAQYRR